MTGSICLCRILFVLCHIVKNINKSTGNVRDNDNNMICDLMNNNEDKNNAVEEKVVVRRSSTGQTGQTDKYVRFKDEVERYNKNDESVLRKPTYAEMTREKVSKKLECTNIYKLY